MATHYELLTHPLRGHVAVKRGFSWPAALLAWVWALRCRLWHPGVILLAIHAVLGFLTTRLLSENYALLGAIVVAVHAYAGARGNAWRSRELQGDDWRFQGLIPASSAAEAVAKFLRVGDSPPPEWRTAVVPPAFVLMPAAWQQLLAVARLTIQAAFRFRLIPILAVVLLIVVVGLPSALKHDGTARGLVQIVITYSLGAVTAVLGLVTLWLATGTLARDVEECQMQMLAVKPVPRWQIWLGKWLGVMGLNAMLLGMSGLAIFLLVQWRAASLPEKQQTILRHELLVARGSLKQPRPDLDADVEKVLKQRLRETGATGVDAVRVRKDLREQVKSTYQNVPPRYSRSWMLETGSARSRMETQPVYLRLKFRSSLMAAKPEPYQAYFEIGPPGSTNRVGMTLQLTTDTFHEMPLNLLDTAGKNVQAVPVKGGQFANLLDDQGRLFIQFVNLDPRNATLIFDLDDGIEVLYREGGFGLNFARGCAIIFCWLGLLAAIGLVGASYLSFPVAAFFAITVLILGLMSGTIATVVTDGTVGSTNHEGGGPDTSIMLIDFIAVPAFKVALKVLNLVQGFSPIDALSTGRSVSWGQLARAYSQIWLLVGGGLALFGMLIFTRRELATAQGAH